MQQDIQEKILITVVDIQSRVVHLEEEVGHLRDSHDRTFRRIDDFLSTLSRHESEIAALRSSRERIEERLSRVEQMVGISANA